MKNYLKIQSNGEIEIEAFTLIGASSKRNDETKIGYYGSGLKYSISSMLRNKIDFRIFKGDSEVVFNLATKRFRNEDYAAICVNGHETSLTTTMGGIDWDKPFAPIREIYSNAIDEDEDAILDKTSQVFGEVGKTTFFIEYTEEIRHFFENYDLYFSNKIENVLFTNEHVTCYPQNENQDTRLYRKGILCYYDKNVKSLYNYNSKNFTINESRVLDNTYLAKSMVAGGWKLCNNVNIITSLLNGLKGGNAGFYEHDLDFSTYRSTFSNAWFEAMENGKYVPAEMAMFCSERELAKRVILPIKLLKPLFAKFPELDILGLSKNPNEVNYVIQDDVSEILTNKVIDSVSLLKKTRYAVRLKNINIQYVKFEDHDVLGLAENNTIFLSTRLETNDIMFIAKVIIEENEHNISGFGDKTRAFQNHLFELLFDQLIAN